MPSLCRMHLLVVDVVVRSKSIVEGESPGLLAGAFLF